MNYFDRYTFTVKERFLRYVTVDTQSDPASPTCPSTAKQLNLARILVDELLQVGLSDAAVDENGYVYATIPSTTSKNVPVICFCSHMDTSPDCSGTNVVPIVHHNYQGNDLVLPDEPAIVICQSEHPDLRHQLGNDLITASGKTLLGADNKAGLAEIMDAANFLISHPEVKHGPIRLLFTPDEEIGRGVNRVNLERLGADYAYTVDGETLGSLEDETFSADGAVLTITGVSTHPGFAKGRMESAIKIAAAIIAGLPAEKLSPESTEGVQGFIHPVSVSGSVEEASIEFILRDFATEGLAEHRRLLETIAGEVMRQFPNSTYQLKVTEQYRNMKEILRNHPNVVAHAVTAIERAGITPKLQRIRGGTDGSRLSFMGLPCPNIFAGEHAFHGKQEWVSVQDMEYAVRTIVHLAEAWAIDDER